MVVADRRSALTSQRPELDHFIRRLDLARSYSCCFAKIPGPGNSIDSSERTISSLTKVWPLWLLFGAVALVFCVGGNWWLNRHPTNVNWMTVIIVFSFAGLWLILYWHNARILPALVGFDASHHLNYIKYLQEHHRLPLPNEGMVMFHPPLYYILSAIALSIFNLTTADPSAILLLRALTMLFGIAQFLLRLRHSATDFSRSPQPSTDWRRSGRFSANATLPVTLSHERDLGGTSCFRFSLFCTSDDEDQPGNVEKLLHSWAANRRCDADKGDRCFSNPALSSWPLPVNWPSREPPSQNGPERSAACSSLPPCSVAGTTFGFHDTGAHSSAARIPSLAPSGGRTMAITRSLISPALVKVWSAHYLAQPHRSGMGSILLYGVMDYAVVYRTYRSARPGTII